MAYTPVRPTEPVGRDNDNKRSRAVSMTETEMETEMEPVHGPPSPTYVPSSPAYIPTAETETEAESLVQAAKRGDEARVRQLTPGAKKPMLRKSMEAAAEHGHTGVLVAIMETADPWLIAYSILEPKQVGIDVFMAFLREGDAEGLARLFKAADCSHRWWSVISPVFVSAALSRMMEAPEAARDGLYLTLVGKLSEYADHLRMALIDVKMDMTTALKSAACTPGAALSLIKAGAQYHRDAMILIMQKASRASDWQPVVQAMTRMAGWDAKDSLDALRAVTSEMQNKEAKELVE